MTLISFKKPPANVYLRLSNVGPNTIPRFDADIWFISWCSATLQQIISFSSVSSSINISPQSNIITLIWLCRLHWKNAPADGPHLFLWMIKCISHFKQVKLQLFNCKFSTQYAGERILKICQYLVKIWTKVWWHVLLTGSVLDHIYIAPGRRHKNGVKKKVASVTVQTETMSYHVIGKDMKNYYTYN